MYLGIGPWWLLQPFLEAAPPPRRSDSLKDSRALIEAVSLELYTGMQRVNLQNDFPLICFVFVRHRLQFSNGSYVFLELLTVAPLTFVQERRTDLDQWFIDANLVPARGGGKGMERAKKGEGTKLEVAVNGEGAPLRGSVDRACGLGWHMVPESFHLFSEQIETLRLISDKVYDCDELNETFADLGWGMIPPHLKNLRTEDVTRQGRTLRRHRHRWIVAFPFTSRAARRRPLLGSYPSKKSSPTLLGLLCPDV